MARPDPSRAARARGPRCNRCPPPQELRPLSLDHFRVDQRTNEPLKLDRQQRRLDHYNSRRAFKLGLVLTASRNLEHTSAEVQESKQREMRKLFARSLLEEKRRLRKMERDRLKRQTVLERENEQLLLRRKKWDRRKETIARKHQRIAEMQEEQQRRQRQRAEQHAAAIQAAQQAREDKEERSRREAAERQAERERRMQRFMEERTRQMHRTREKEKEREEQRRRVRDQSDKRLNQRRQEMWQAMSRKEQHVQRVQEQKVEELEGEKEERFLRSISRKENARRIRKEREYHKRQLAERMKDSYRKMEILAVRGWRACAKIALAFSAHRWTIPPLSPLCRRRTCTEPSRSSATRTATWRPLRATTGRSGRSCSETLRRCAAQPCTRSARKGGGRRDGLPLPRLPSRLPHSRRRAAPRRVRASTTRPPRCKAGAGRGAGRTRRATLTG